MGESVATVIGLGPNRKGGKAGKSGPNQDTADQPAVNQRKAGCSIRNEDRMGTGMGALRRCLTTVNCVVLPTVLLLGCNADFVPLPGGALTGRVALPPADWSAIGKHEVIRLETKPAEPYSVKLWIVERGAALYVHAGANRTAWVAHMEADSNVKVLMGEALYELSADRVTRQDEFDAFANDYEAKYGTRPRNENVSEAYVYRLRPRN